MAKLLFKLAGVPDDEAEEVRQLLETQQIDYYETSAGLLGLSFAAIWITDDDKLSEARSLLDDYQLKRKENADAIKAKQIELGLQISLWHMFRRSPIRVLMVLVFCLVVLYLAIIPFFPSLAGQ